MWADEEARQGWALLLRPVPVPLTAAAAWQRRRRRRRRTNERTPQPQPEAVLKTSSRNGMGRCVTACRQAGRHGETTR